MAINFPSYKTVVNRIRSDVRAKLPGSDPTIFGTFLRALSDSIASRIFDLVQLIEQAVDLAFIQTSTGVYLDRLGAYKELTLNPATVSIGQILMTGTVGSTIPVDTSIRSSDGNLYEIDAGLTLNALTIVVSTLVQTGGVATATAVGHSLATGSSPTISGAAQSEYNGTFSITVIDEDTFSYSVDSGATSPATGAISAAIDGGLAQITSNDTGAAQNLDSGAVLSLVSPISGVDATAYVRFDGITGGVDVEPVEGFRARILDAFANPVSNFNPAAITRLAKAVSGVGRVFVKRITPSVGDVTVYFLTTDPVNPIPSTTLANTVKDAILVELPVTSDPENVYVTPPTGVTVPFTFSAISPDTTTMRAAITANLQAFFEDRVEFEQDITEDQYRLAIQNTQDPDTGNNLATFTLSTPTTDITISTGEIGLIGAVTFT